MFKHQAAEPNIALGKGDGNSRQQQCVLVIDDSASIQDLVAAHLEAEHLGVHAAYNGELGLAMAVELLPDLILLDIEMPVENGFEVCRRLKADPRLRDVPVIFLTGASSSSEKQQGLEMGAVDYVTKPFDGAELGARVRAALRTKELLGLLAHKAKVLEESEERFRFLAENSSELISCHSRDGVYRYASPASAALLGYEASELIGRRLLDLVHPADAAQLKDIGAHGTEKTRTATFRLLRKDGSAVWVEAAMSQVRDGSEVQISSRDVSRRVWQEELERDRTHILELVAQGQPLGEIFTRITELVQKRCPGTAACVVALSEGQMHVAGPSLPPEFLGALSGNALRLAASVCSDLATQGLASSVTDLRKESVCEPIRNSAARHGLTFCCWRLVTCSLHGVVGMVGVVHDERKAEYVPVDSALLETAASLASMAIEHRQLTERLAYQAQHDALTGLPNRQLFETRIQQAITAAARTGQHVGLMFFDIDRFKLINDTLGHLTGDDLLRQFAARTQLLIRQGDTLARLGGDEFALLIPSLNEAEQAVQVASRIQQSIARKFELGDKEVAVTTSIGIAVYPTDGGDASVLQRHADTALYRVKASGRNAFQRYVPEMSAKQARRLEMESRLRSALENSEFTLVYQPQVTPDGVIVGAEALLRWTSPTLGTVPPTEFIVLAEETGLIIPIGAWVLRQACRQAKRWHAAGFPELRIAVNVSALQFAQADFTQVVSSILADCDLAPQHVELEVTESLVMHDIEQSAAKLQHLAGLGVNFAVDDFGTGHSSLAYLHQLPLCRLKIDRSFIAGLTADAIADSTRTAIIRAIMSMADTLGFTVVAEGVETDEQRRFLASLGCDFMQGYYFSRPLSPTQLEQLMKDQQCLAARPYRQDTAA